MFRKVMRLRDGRCCATCKHSQHSPRWCYHPLLRDTTPGMFVDHSFRVNATDVCDAYEGREP